jgi:hypothetical protein
LPLLPVPPTLPNLSDPKGAWFYHDANAKMRAARGRIAFWTTAPAAALAILTGIACAESGNDSIDSSQSADVTAQSQAAPSGTKEMELGTGTFSRSPFHLSASVRGGYDDNVATSDINRQASWFTNASGTVTYNFGDARTQLSLQAGGGVTYYWDRITGAGFDNQQYDINSTLALTIRHKASPRLTFDLNTYASYQTEPDFAIAFGLNRRSGNFFYTQDRLTTTYLWTPRFSTATSYTFGALHYDDMSVGLFEDRWENTFGNECRFLLWPTTTLVAEYRLGLVNYMHEGEPTGPTVIINGRTPQLDRDSITHYLLAGFDHTFNSRFNMSVRGGAEFRDYPDAVSDDNQSAPYFEGTLNYTVNKFTTLTWNNRYAIEEPDVLLNPNRKTFRTGIRATHNLTPRVSAILGAYYEHDDYGSVTNLNVVTPGFTEQAVDLALSFRYAVTRYFGVEAGYDYTDVWSDVVFREYSRNRCWAGLNVTF